MKPSQRIVAIDVGTTRTGFAYYVLKNENNEIKIKPQDSIYGEIRDLFPESDLGSLKNLTGLLYKKNERNPCSWGAKAYMEYINGIQEKGEDYKNEYEYIKKFKLQLTKEISNNQDAFYNDTNRSVTNLMSAILKLVKEDALNEIFKDSIARDEKMITWVITVPVTWGKSYDKDFGRKLMRQAAIKAGLVGNEDIDRLLLVQAG